MACITFGISLSQTGPGTLKQPTSLGGCAPISKLVTFSGCREKSELGKVAFGQHDSFKQPGGSLLVASPLSLPAATSLHVQLFPRLLLHALHLGRHLPSFLMPRRRVRIKHRAEPWKEEWACLHVPDGDNSRMVYALSNRCSGLMGFDASTAASRGPQNVPVTMPSRPNKRSSRPGHQFRGHLRHVPSMHSTNKHCTLVGIASTCAKKWHGEKSGVDA